MQLNPRTLALFTASLTALFSTSIASAAMDWSGSGDPDYNALSLAQQLAQVPAGKKPPKEVVRQIFSNSQIALVDRNGQISPENGQGLKVDGWNVDLLPEAMAKGISMTLDELVLYIQLAHDGLNKTLPAHPVVDPALRTALLKDLRTMTELDEGDQTGVRHMAHVIVQIGLNAEEPYDLLDPKISGEVKLNAVQAFLILHRFSAELAVYARKFRPLHGEYSFHRLDLMALKASDLPSVNTPAPCHMTETEGLVMDGVATGSGFVLGGVAGFPGVLNWLENYQFLKDTQVEKFGKITSVANIAGNVAKLLVTMWSFKAEIKATPSPLERTQTLTPGKEGKVTAKFWLDTGNPQIANCVRPALNAVGLDFSLPNDGPLVGSLAEWLIQTRVGSKNDVLETFGSNPLQGITDKNGVTEISIRGKKQQRDLSHKVLLQVERTVPVRAQINLKNKNGTQDVIDVAAGLGGVSALWSLPFELLNRMPLIYGANVDVKVIDWKELEGDLFEINGIYSNPEHKESWDAKMTGITDGFITRIEVKASDQDNTTAEILTFANAQTQYRDDYPSNFFAGEGCRATQSPTNRYEAFTSLPLRTEVMAHYIPGYEYPPGLPLPPGTPAKRDPLVIVEFKTQGAELTRGWRYSFDHPSCALEDVVSSEHDVQLYLKFDSKELHQVGQKVTRDQRDPATGIGWLFEITYIK